MTSRQSLCHYLNQGGLISKANVQYLINFISLSDVCPTAQLTGQYWFTSQIGADYRSTLKVPQCTYPISLNAPFRTEMHTCSEWWIVGYDKVALWDLWDHVSYPKDTHCKEMTIFSWESLHWWDTVKSLNIRCTKSQHLKDSRTVLRLSLPNPLKPDVKSRMKM